MTINPATELVVEPLNGGARLSWVPPVPGSEPITGYRITAMRGSVMQTYDVPADWTEAIIADLVNCVPPPPPYADAVLALSPLWFFRFDNPAVNLDSSTHNWHIDNGYSTSIDVPGLYPSPTNPGRARSYPGNQPTSTLDVTGVTGDRSATFAAGVSLVGGTGGENMLASVVGPIAGGHSIMFGFATTGEPKIHCYGGGSEIQLTAPISMAGAGPHHLVWRWDKASFAVDIWLDGAVVASGNNGGPIRPGSGLRQFTGANGRPFAGTVDEASWFDAALTDEQVAGLYASWAGGE